MEKLLLNSTKFTTTLVLLGLLFNSSFSFAQSTANYTFSTGTTGSLASDLNSNTVDMTTGTTGLLTTTSSDDVASGVTSIGFDFYLMGNLYTQFSVSSNGGIMLGSTAILGNSYQASTGTTASPVISAFTSDLAISSTALSGVRSKVVGTAPNRCLVVEFKGMTLYYSSNYTNDGTWQVRLYETTGDIEFVYGNMKVTSSTGPGTVADKTTGIGFSTNTTATNFVYVTSSTNSATASGTFTDNATYANSLIANLDSATDGSRRFYRFAQTPPSAPTGLSFTNVTATTMTLNWTDVASNELGYVIYYSTDNIDFTFIGQLAAGATGSNITSLVGGIQYYFKVYAVREGALSAPLSGSQTTPGQASFTTTGASTFIPPVGVSAVTVQAWGAGGGGGSRTTNGQAGGGGGGAYASSLVTVTGGTSYNLTVGAGGASTANGGNSTFNTSSVIAEGGKGVANNTTTGGVAGLAANSTGTTKFSGGTGGTASGGTSGGGGGGAGTTGAGGNASAGTAGTGTSVNGGNGGAGVTGSVGGNAGNIYGAGGSGASRTAGTQNGGAGAQGLVVVNWICPTYAIATGISATTPATTGSTSTVTVNSTSGSLPNGTYTVTYSLSGANTNVGQTASLTISSGTGTFTTIAIANAGATTITITNLSNGISPASCSNAVTTNNTTIISINSVTFNTAGTTSFTVPTGITCVKVDAIGAGGGGSTRTTNGTNTGGGGGGGAFASGSVAVTSGSSYTVVVGAGGAASTAGGNSTFNATSVVAAGGSGGTNNSTTAGAGGTTAASTGNIIRYKGGDGANGGATSGAGGGGAGTTGAGGNASNGTAGTGTTLNGGAGGGGVTGSVNGNTGNNYGGGGSGASTNSNADRIGGSGANGLVTITWVDATNFSTSATTAVCSNNTATVTVTSTTLADGTYTVTYNTTNPSTTGNTASMVFSGATGTFTTINLTNATSAAVTATITITSLTFTGWTCGTTVSSGNTANVTVNPRAAVTAMTNAACSGVGFTSTPVDVTNGVVPLGTTYSWSAPTVTGGLTGGASGSGASSITGALTNPTNSAQTATYTVTPTSGSCGGATFTITVTVNPNPAITAMTNTACSGVGFTSTPVNTTNGVVPSGTTYSWSAPTVTGGLTGGASGSGASSITGTLTNPTNTVQTATYTVTPTSGGCGGATFTLTVTVNPKPAITAMTNTACSGVGFTSTPVNTTNGVVPSGTTYSWSAPTVTGGMTGGASGSGASSITGTLTNPTNTAQTATYTVTPTSGGCGGATFTLTVTVNPKPAITAMTNTACSGVGFTSTPVNTTNGVVPSGTTYSWSAPTVTGGMTGGASGSGASSITGTLTNPTNTAQTATYTVTPTSGSCGGSTFTLTVTVNPKPAITAMTNTSCSGVGFTSTPVNTTNGVVPSGTTYSWSAPTVTGGLTGGASGSGASSITGTLTNPTNIAQTATYTVTPTFAGCSGSAFTLTVAINPKASASVISGDASICSGNSTNLQVAITGGTSPYTVVYTGGTLPSYTSGSNISVSPSSTTIYSITSVTDANGCIGAGNTGTATVTLTTTTTTDGGVTWNNGTPSNVKAVVYDGSTGTISSDISGCALRLTNNATVTVASGSDVTLSGAITVDSGSTFTLNNNANLLQGGTTNTNTGNINVKRNSSLLYRLDYTLWSSPVASQKLFTFSPLTSISPTVRFYTYNTSTDAYNSVSGVSAGVSSTDVFGAGIGYLIRMPFNWPIYVSPSTPGTSWTGTFNGKPNNGDIQVSLSNAGNGYNAVGNPYPSAVDIETFLTNNSGSIDQTLWFWRRRNASGASAYVTYSGGTYSSGSQTYYNLEPGQGFFVKYKGSGPTLIDFKNTQRVGTDGVFFKNANTTNDTNSSRIWLNLISQGDVVGTMALGYKAGATNGLDDQYDGKYINDSQLALNSIIDNTELSVQHRTAPFNASDVVPLSLKADVAGTYSISIKEVDGVFSGGAQAIYLKDNLTTTLHNLNTGDYTFATTVGSFTDRFEIVYLNPLIVDNPTFTANSVVIFNQNNQFVVNSGNTIMASIKVFDIRGRLLQEKKSINSNQTTINGGLANEVLLVQITSEDGIVVTKKVIR